MQPATAAAVKVWLDRLSGRVTMYRLVLLVLVVLGIAAAIGGAVHLLPFPPQAVLIAAVVSVTASYGSNRLFAWIWRVRPHGESSLITGMLVFCLFFPLLDLQSLAAIVIAAVAANLSKYVFAWHGRHIFNPVAVGAVVVTLTRISGASWWIATPPLLPVILLGGALVLYRTGAWDIALTVVAITVTASAVTLAATGTPLLDAVRTAITSYPYLFFAAFMVSEPLTLPPRRRRRLLVGALIGVAAVIPVHLGYVVMAPEIALLLGNALAFGFGQRHRIRLTLVGRRDLSPHTGELVFRPERPMRFKAGQYVELSLPHRHQDGRGARRAFSIASRPGADQVRILTRWASPGSSFKTRLSALSPGDQVTGSVVGGDFLLPADSTTPLLWIAGGIGITPFVSFADDLAARGEHRDIVLIHLIRDEADLEFAALLTSAHIRTLILAPEALAARLPPGLDHAGSDLADLDLAQAVPDARDRLAYIAGSPSLLATARHLLKSAHVHRIRTDRFLGY